MEFTTKEATVTAYETTRHANKAAYDEARKVVERAPSDRDEARRYFKREASRSLMRFDATADETTRTFEAVYSSRMKAEAEARA